MNSHDWSYSVQHDLQPATASDGQPSLRAKPLGRWSAEQSTRRPVDKLQRARYAGQAAAVLLGVVSVCSAIGHIAFG